MTSEELGALLVVRELPELIAFSEEFIRPVMQMERTSIILFTNNVNRDRVKPYFLEFEKAANEAFGTFERKEDELLFVTSGVSFGIQIRIAEVFGAREEELPALYVMQPSADTITKKWRYTAGPVEDLTVEKVRSFINDFRAGNLTREYKSEPVPEKASGPKEVRKIVGKTWHQEINDPKKELLVAHMSEFCRKCRDLEEVWQELAASTPADLVIAILNVD